MHHSYISHLLKFAFCFVFLQLSVTSYGQSVPNSEYYFSKNEFGVSVTSILSNVLSFNANSTQSPYGMFYRRRMNKSFLRIGLDLASEKKTNSGFDPNTGTFNESELRSGLTNVRIGIERNIQISKNLQFFGGIDLFGQYSKENSKSNFSFVSDDISYLGGGGPAIRLEYRLGKRLFLSTESTLYYGYGRHENTAYLNGELFSSVNENIYRLKLSLPTVLFISVQL